LKQIAKGDNSYKDGEADSRDHADTTTASLGVDQEHADGEGTNSRKSREVSVEPGPDKTASASADKEPRSTSASGHHQDSEEE
jgi:hypothetical protein